MKNSFSPGHPWYYKLGGKTLNPTQIMLAVQTAQYRSYLKDDIESINKRAEPKRKKQLKNLRTNCRNRLKDDLERYRELVIELRAYRKQHGEIDESDDCSELFMSLSLKHNHIFNHMAALHYIDELLMKSPTQYELFA